MRGYVQVYTGNGKGKTTAALGLLFRAVGAGLRVWIGQFLKGQMTSELAALVGLPNEAVTVERFGADHFVLGIPSAEDLEEAARGLTRLQEITRAGKYDVVIADEVNVAVSLKLIAVEAVLDLVDSRPPHVELILTGRNADRRILDAADLVTEMRCVKHYHAQGVAARKGIEW